MYSCVWQGFNQHNKVTQLRGQHQMTWVLCHCSTHAGMFSNACTTHTHTLNVTSAGPRPSCHSRVTTPHTSATCSAVTVGLKKTRATASDSRTSASSCLTVIRYALWLPGAASSPRKRLNARTNAACACTAVTAMLQCYKEPPTPWYTLAALALGMWFTCRHLVHQVPKDDCHYVNSTVHPQHYVNSTVHSQHSINACLRLV